MLFRSFEPDWSQEIAHVTFNIGDDGELDTQDLFVKDRFRGAGVAKVMYDYVKSKGYAIHRSHDQTPAGAGFWDKHRGEERVWEDADQPISPEFQAAVENWQEMWDTDAAAKIILASPEAKPFMKPPVGFMYVFRAVKQLNTPSKNTVIAYSLAHQGAENFAKTLDIPGKWYLTSKNFNPADFLLDFSAMIQHYKLAGDRDMPEYEIWMKPTPYYTTATKDEVFGTFRT